MTARGLLPAMVVALVVGIALPAAASANTYCVNTSGTCSQTFSSTQLQDALDAAVAHGGHDLVRIGPGTYSRAGGFSYQPVGSPANPIDIDGAGSGQTTITMPPGDDSTVLTVNPSQPDELSTLSDFRAALPVGSNDIGLSVNAATATRVSVTAPATLTSGTGVALGGTLTNSTVALPTGPPTVGVSEEGVDATVEGSTIAARTGIYNPVDVGITTNVRRSDISAKVGILSNVGSTVVAENDVIRIAGAGQTGIEASSTSGFSAAVTADHVTILGDANEFTSTGVRVTSQASATAEATVTNSIIVGTFTGWERSAGTSGGHANLTIRYSDLGSAAFADDDPPSPGLTLGPGNVSGVGPMFVSPPGNLRLQATSPLIDAGDPAGCGGTDRDGKPRVVDGDGNGTPLTDMGAYERQTSGKTCPPAPPPSGGNGGGSPSAPSNEFSLGKVKRNKKKGTAKLTVSVPGAGGLELAGTKVKPTELQSGGAGEVGLPVKARGKAKKRLKRQGKAKVSLEVTFTPTGGDPNTLGTSVKLKRKK